MTDIAAHADAGAAPRVRFSKLTGAERSLAPSPAFLLGPATAAVNDELFAQTRLHAIGCYTLNDAVLAPTGIAMKDGVAFSSPAFLHPPHHVSTVVSRFLASDLPSRHVRGPLAVMYGPSHETYGHWLVDFLPRLWVLMQTGHDVHTLRYAVPPDLAPFAAKLLSRVGIRAAQLVPYRYWHEAIHTDLLLMPTGLRLNNRISPLFAEATRFWTAGLHRAAAGEPGAGARLFVSRAQAPGGRRLLNRDAIEAVAQSRGYVIVHPQTMRLTAQVAVFANASIIAGEYGSALHGSVFAPPGTLTLGLRGNLRHPSFVQSGVAGALGQAAAYVVGETQGDVEQSFSIRVEDFELALEMANVRKQGLLF